MTIPADADADYFEVGDHSLSPVPGGVRYDEIWGCERCGTERVHLEHFEDVDCET